MCFSKRIGILFFFFSVGAFAFVDSSRDHIEFSPSVAHSYGARNVFINPAALGYETELNGSGLMSSFGFTLNDARSNEGSFSLSYSYLGFGYEKISGSLGQMDRYGFSLGVPVGTQLYLGTRYTFSRSGVLDYDHYGSFDLGLQFRYSPLISVGVLFESLNEPVVNGIQKDVLTKGGVVVKPIRSLELSGEVSTPSSSFMQTINYQGTVSYEILRGLRVQAGYHNEREFQAGVQFNVGLGSYTAAYRPQPADQSFLFIGDFSHKPYRSFMKANQALVVKLDSSLSEEPVPGNLFREARPSLAQVLRLLETAKVDPNVSAVVVKIEDFPLGLGAAQDLSQMLASIRKTGKKVTVHLGNAGMTDYLIASSANEITMDPSGSLEFLGVRSSRYYFKGTLDKIGAKAELFGKGKYKSAPETFNRKGPSEADLEATQERLVEGEKALQAVLKTNREKVASKWAELVKHGIFSPPDAEKMGLVDQIDSYTSFEKKLESDARIVSNLDVMDDRLALKDRIAIVVAEGEIVNRKSTLLSLGGMSVVTPELMEKKMLAAVSDPRTKAVVLRVSSPGGEVLASQEIADLIKSASKLKPIYVSMGDVAASGGYFISAPTKKIFSQDLTATGSIGVFMGKADLSGLYGKIDLHKEIFSRSPYAGLFSEHKALSPEETKIIVRRLDQFYDHFISYVSESRKIPKKEVDDAAQGRVWLGQSALKRKLVDEIKSYQDVIRLAAGENGLSEGNYQADVVTTGGGLLSMLSNPMSLHSGSLKLPKDILRQLSWVEADNRAQFFYLAPDAELQ